MGAMRGKDKASKTTVFIEEYRGAKVFCIYPVKENGEKFSDFAKVSFGCSKAKSILKHLDELKTFVDSYEGKED